MIEFDSVKMAKEKDKEKRQRLAELDKIMESEIQPKKTEKQPEIPRVSPIEQESPEFGSSEIQQTGYCNLLEMIYDYADNDVLEIFWDTRTGKTAFVKKVAHDAAEAGKKVFYLDTERNLTKKDIELLKNCTYKYAPVIEEIDRIVQNIPAGDIVILDSVGFPILKTFARMNMKQKGDTLLKLIAIFGSLEEWAYKNNSIVLVTNQPENEFNKAPGHILRPFGDKSQFAAKEIWETIKESSNPKLTKISIRAFRSRSMGYGTSIAQMRISNSGVDILQIWTEEWESCYL
jgi:hypothetical protein